MDAIVSESPAEITLRFFSASSPSSADVSGDYDIYRKHPDDLTWADGDGKIGSVTIGTVLTTWTDTNVVVGERYEYGIALASTSSGGDGSSGDDAPGSGGGYTPPPVFMNGNVIAGIKADMTEARGRVALVLTREIAAALPDELATYEADLVRDGWVVHRILVDRAPDYLSNGSGPNDEDGIPTAPYPDDHVTLKSQLVTLYQQYPSELKQVVLIGKVPVARSGTGYFGPDGHGNKTSFAADAYYADMDGIWEDSRSNKPYYTSNISSVVKNGKINVAGDLKFDATHLYEVDGPENDLEDTRLELGFGRIDLSLGIQAEIESTRNYFNKLHRYKTATSDFQPGRRAIHRSQFGSVKHAYLGGIPGVLGMEQLDFITSSDLPSSPDGDNDAMYTRDVSGPYLFYFKGSGTPGLSNGSQAVFWTGMQSHWGYWYERSDMAQRLAEDNFTLSYTWTIANGAPYNSYLYHRLGMGGTTGDMMRASMSYRYPYTSKATNYVAAYNPLFMNHIGDPTLRVFMFQPPTDLQVLPNGGEPELSWTASTAPAGEPPVIGYHVYRSANAGGPFERITSTPLTATTFTDSAQAAQTWHYQVKAIRLEDCGGGSYYNSSLAAQQEVDLLNPAQTLQIASPATLPSIPWKTSTGINLEASGGTPLFSWTLISGALPSGITLQAGGHLTGIPDTAGTYNFELEVTDALGQIDQKAFSLEVHDQDFQTLIAEASTHVRGHSAYRDRTPASQTIQIAGGNHRYDGYLRFDLNDLDENQGIGTAKIILIPDGNTPANSIVIKAALGEDAGDAWDETSITFNTRPADQTVPAEITATEFAVLHSPFELDVTPFVKSTLKNDPNKILSIHLSSETSAGWGNQVTASGIYATSLARPRLEVQTHRWLKAENWKEQHFDQTGNTGDAADDANPAGDGIPNLVKFALGLDPNTDYRGNPEAPRMQITRIGEEDFLTFSFTQDPDATGVNIRIEGKDSLTDPTWEILDPMVPANQLEVLEDHPRQGVNTIKVKDSKSNPGKRFLRMKAERPE